MNILMLPPGAFTVCAEVHLSASQTEAQQLARQQWAFELFKLSEQKEPFIIVEAEDDGTAQVPCGFWLRQVLQARLVREPVTLAQALAMQEALYDTWHQRLRPWLARHAALEIVTSVTYAVPPDRVQDAGQWRTLERMCAAEGLDIYRKEMWVTAWENSRRVCLPHARARAVVVVTPCNPVHTEDLAHEITERIWDACGCLLQRVSLQLSAKVAPHAITFELPEVPLPPKQVDWTWEEAASTTTLLYGACRPLVEAIRQVCGKRGRVRLYLVLVPRGDPLAAWNLYMDDAARDTILEGLRRQHILLGQQL